MNELWKDIPGYEGVYQASTAGNIRTCEGKTTSNTRYARRVWKQRVLKQKYAKRKGRGKSDARVSLWKDGKEKTWLVSRLIAMTWCDGYADELTVNHIDGNPCNNRAENLEWMTITDNVRHGFETGLFPQKKVLLEDKYGKIFQFRSMASASRYLGKNEKYISCITKRGNNTTPDGYTVIVSV